MMVPFVSLAVLMAFNQIFSTQFDRTPGDVRWRYNLSMITLSIIVWILDNSK